MTIIIDNEHATLQVYANKGIVHHKFNKFIYGEPFKEVLNKGAEAFEQYKCFKWLSDDRENSALRPEDVEWAQTVWEPRILKAGWKHWALILPKKVVGQMNMNRIVDRYKTIGINVEIFTEFEKAIVWLEQQ